MESKVIAQMIVDNGVSDVTKIKAAQEQFSNLVNDLIKTNLEPIIAISDEEQAIDVANEIVTIMLSDDELKKILDKYVPFWLKPLEGMIINKVRPIVTGVILKFIHENILDKANLDWFKQVQTIAKNIQAGI